MEHEGENVLFFPSVYLSHGISIIDTYFLILEESDTVDLLYFRAIGSSPLFPSIPIHLPLFVRTSQFPRVSVYLMVFLSFHLCLDFGCSLSLRLYVCLAVQISQSYSPFIHMSVCLHLR